MILSDINLLLYAFNVDDERHAQAKNWLEQSLNDDKLCVSWHILMGFLRISTSPTSFPTPYSATESLAIIQSLLEHPNTILLAPGKNHFAILRKIVIESQTRGPRIMDAHIAALAIENGVTLASNDRDFRLFDGLKLISPLTISN